MFHGVFTALVTPFLNGKIDFSSLEKLIDLQLSGGVAGFVICGTTGESPTLEETEQLDILDFISKKVETGVPVLFGSGSHCTKKTIRLSQKACQYPIEALLVVVPYYNKPPQKGLLAHFKTVADNVEKPILLYNVPGRTGTALESATIIELSKHPNIVGIKEADSDLNQFSKYKNSVPKDFALFSGDDKSCVEFCLLGGQGVISVCSHLAPAQMVSWIKRACNQDRSIKDEFKQQHPWIEKLSITSNPIPVKAALKNQGIITSKELRLPLVALSHEMEEEMMETMNRYRISS